MINKCRYGIVMDKTWTQSREPEIQATFMYAITARQVLAVVIPDLRKRRRYKIVKLEEL